MIAHKIRNSMEDSVMKHSVDRLTTVILLILAVLLPSGVFAQQEDVQPEHQTETENSRPIGPVGPAMMPIVDSSDVLYLVKPDGDTSSLIGVNSSGSQTTVTFDTKIMPPIISDDETLLLSASYSRESDASVVYIIPLPLSDSYIQVQLNGRVASPPLAKNSLIYA
ncbi:secreted protein, partial [Candidatus Magnetoovum chiemensis]